MKRKKSGFRVTVPFPPIKIRKKNCKNQKNSRSNGRRSGVPLNGIVEKKTHGKNEMSL